MARLYQVPIQNALQYTLDTGYTSGGGTLTLNSSLTGIIQAPGVCVVDRIDSSGNLTATKRDYFTFTGVSGAQLTGCVGGLAGSTNQDHSVGAIVEFIPDITWGQAVYDVITQEHSVMGQHMSLPSLSQVRTQNLSILSAASGIDGSFINFYGASTATINMVNTRTLAVASQASILSLNVSGMISASGASVVGFPSTGGTGGLNALFQVPGALASYGNVGGLIPIPVAFTAGFMQAFVQTPASLASVSATLLKNNAVVGVVAVLAGATFASSASFSTTTLTAGDELRLNINSTASSAYDLSVMLRAT